MKYFRYIDIPNVLAAVLTVVFLLCGKIAWPTAIVLMLLTWEYKIGPGRDE